MSLDLETPVPAHTAARRRSRLSRLLTLDTGATLAILLGGILFAALADSRYWTQILQIFVLYSGVAIWTGALVSWAGQMSFGQGAVFGVGAYGAAIAMTNYQISFWVALVLGTVAGVVFSVLFALPALRVSGFYLGFLTISVAIVFPDAVIQLPELTGGIRGISPPVQTFLYEPIVASLTPLVLIIAGFGVFSVLTYATLRRSGLGRQMVTSKESSEAASTLGISPGRVRSIAFLLSGAVCGLAGALYVPVIGYIGTDAFSVDLSMLFFFAVIAGGAGYASGATLGVAVLYLVPNVLLASFSEYRLLAYGVITLAIIALMPSGVVGTIAQRVRSRTRGSASELSEQLHAALRSARTEETR